MKKNILAFFASIFLLLVIWNCTESPNEPKQTTDNVGATFYPVLTSGGFLILPNNLVTDFSGSTVVGVYNSDGTITSSEGIVLESNVNKNALSAITPALFVINPDGSVTDINGTPIGVMDPSGNIVLPNGAVYSGSGDLLIPPTILSSATEPLSSAFIPLSNGEVPLSSAFIPFSSGEVPYSSAVIIPTSSSSQFVTPNSSSNWVPPTSSWTAPSSSSVPKSSSSVAKSSSSQGSQAPNIKVIQGGKSGSGYATRYWDSCKPHCAWEGKGGPVARTCQRDGTTRAGSGESSVCDGGNAGTCFDQTPIIINNDYAYAFAATPGGGNDCGKCYMLTFKGTGADATNTPTDDAHRSIKGKKLIVMSNNIGYDVNHGQFDIMIPGGGPGAFNGCQQMGISCAGAQYGGFLTTCNYKKDCLINMCNQEYGNKPSLKEGCLFLANWMNAANNPEVDYVEVECPSELTSKY
ncbi:MAG TPA: hypothetical protein PLT31_02300 [Fibrobacteraceae bacterium]|nr:hypothetical protein [Fibrobacteraceae bacterium]